VALTKRAEIVCHWRNRSRGTVPIFAAVTVQSHKQAYFAAKMGLSLSAAIPGRPVNGYATGYASAFGFLDVPMYCV
jgi:hypothetical protein